MPNSVLGLSLLAAHQWKAGGLNLVRIFRGFQGTTAPFCDYGPVTLWYNRLTVQYQVSHINFTHAGPPNPPCIPGSSYLYFSDLGQISAVANPTFNDYNITGEFFGSQVIGGVTYTWSQGSGW